MTWNLSPDWLRVHVEALIFISCINVIIFDSYLRINDSNPFIRHHQLRHRFFIFLPIHLTLFCAHIINLLSIVIFWRYRDICGTF